MSADADPVASITANLNYIRAVWTGIKADDGTETIRVWRYADAPTALRALSTHGGDEDWVAWVPPGFEGYIGWLDEGGSFGCFSVSVHEMVDGSRVYIGAHS